MGCRMINKIQVNFSGNDISDEELSVYLNADQAKQKGRIIKADVCVDSDGVDLNYTLECIPFERIRRITGYLVGTTARWNDAKKAELRDRVKHN